MEIQIPEDLIIGKIYKFSSNQINSTDPHMFVYLGNDDGIQYFVCCTSQRPTLDKLIARYNYCPSTFPPIKPGGKNNLPLDTYINCNEIKMHSNDELITKCDSNSFREYGELSYGDFLQIRQAISNSTVADKLVLQVMIHPEEVDD